MTAAVTLGVAAALVGGRLVSGDVVVRDGVIDRVGVPTGSGRGLAVPGLVDVQVNGYAGIDLATADRDALIELRRRLVLDGVTAFAPTVITGALDAVGRALGVIATAHEPRERDRPGHARSLGAHLEGPWISPVRLGTHPGELRRDPDPSDAQLLLAAGPVAIVTLAPELPGAVELIGSLVDHGVVVLLGHSDATATEALAGFAAGARGVTHLFNAMPPLHHRNPGLVGAAFTRPDAVLTLIADGHHLAAETVTLAFAAAAGRIALVTDATAASGMPDGEYVLGDVPVTLAAGAVRNRSGALAGSAATLAGCVRQAVADGVDPAAALYAATTVPSDLLGRSDLGRLVPGARADIAVLDDDLHVERVLMDGTDVR